MFYHFILPLKEYLSYLRLFQYITFRSACAALTALVIVLVFGKIVITWLRNLRFKEEIRELGPESHRAKAGTPTMGGIIIIGSVLVSIVLWGNFNKHYLIALCFATALLTLLGFVDDYIKSIFKKKAGVPGRVKLLVQMMIAAGVALYIYWDPSNRDHATDLFVPFMNGAVADLGYAWVVFAVIVIVSSSNAVNLTDGLDGLAIGTVMSVAVSLGIMCYLSGNVKIAGYLRIPYVPDGAELTVFLAALMGASLGFLWFNSNPASVFMGDTGSLSLGGIIGIVAVMIKKEIFLFIVGGVFVLEAVSVIMQVLYYKLTKKRIFKMAPLHHHFELSGLPEQKVVVRMWIVGIILALLGLSSLKIL
ncbi:MAG: phospho-N-acetylmuramoyl-pentapeptide-transferase [Spirochaetes bacterium]|jgi:phospho-N-acetylmuramoyl-pentapeptide-transferase|nr:phospho-N-acetylmuramoyl-pentapeptide-transferase [Spirochaetota bacterium]